MMDEAPPEREPRRLLPIARPTRGGASGPLTDPGTKLLRRLRVRAIDPTPLHSPRHQHPIHVPHAWENVIPFFVFPPEVRRVIYTTNVIESLHMQL